MEDQPSIPIVYPRSLFGFKEGITALVFLSFLGLAALEALRRFRKK